MLSFKKAEQLKKRYCVHGCFYDLVLEHSRTLPCRNVLEIYDRAAFTTEPDSSALVDAVVIMMNPGKSTPLDDSYVSPKVKSRNLNLVISRETLVEAKADNAQYQMMRLMDYKGWRYLRMINLSDIREPDSRKFAQKLRDPALAKHWVHSIFSPKRTNELRSALRRKQGAPIIAAWGKDPFLIPLAKQCLSVLPDEVVGVPCETDSVLFAHASPSLKAHKERWLNAIIARLPD